MWFYGGSLTRYYLLRTFRFYIDSDVYLEKIYKSSLLKRILYFILAMLIAKCIDFYKFHIFAVCHILFNIYVYALFCGEFLISFNIFLFNILY